MTSPSAPPLTMARCPGPRRRGCASSWLGFGAFFFFSSFLNKRATRRGSGGVARPRRVRSPSGRMASSLAPERVRHVRVAIVGDTGCGKSTLTRVLADDPANTRVERTSGVNPRVRLIDVFDPRANAHRPCFVELWDLDGREDHARARGALPRPGRRRARARPVVVPARAGDGRGAQAVGAGGCGVGHVRRAEPGRVSLARVPDAHRETHPRTSSGGLRGVPVPVLVVGAKAELRRAGGTREASSFAEDDSSAARAQAASTPPSARPRSFAGMRARGAGAALETGSVVARHRGP